MRIRWPRFYTRTKYILVVLLAIMSCVVWLIIVQQVTVTDTEEFPTALYGQMAPLDMYTDTLANLPIPCVILRPIPIPGGIGDQLFRYAFAYATARNLNAPLFLTVTHEEVAAAAAYTNIGAGDRKFALQHFNLNSSMVRYIPKSMSDSISKNKIRRRSYCLDELRPWTKEDLPKDKIILLEDYWQSDIYFGAYRDEIATQFALREVRETIPFDLISDIQSAHAQSVAVHVRKGDFDNKTTLNGSMYRWISTAYQLRAMDLMEHLLGRNARRGHAQVKFFVFTDDTEYVKSALKNTAHNFRLVSNPTQLSSLDEFHLMTKCRHAIISNSGFSWWTAYLNQNPDAIVIAPFPRHRNRFYPPYKWERIIKHKKWLYWNHPYPKSWITMNPYESFQDSM